ncbi:oxygenase MpaB family protein [Allokutzneria oryzae]|uniref:Oxygenase MpaB family protein n=1 Tax=Allokutzneria oryzae TaxID=1378989 RepID=A0ABV5ZQE3_9PSEU
MSIGLNTVRQRVGASLFERVAGPDGPATRDRIDGAPGPRWFGPDSAIRRVHSDASMFVGGLRALLLQSLHPMAMAAVSGHSGYRSDPWGRLQRTSTFLAVTTFGTAQDAQEAIAHVRSVHERIRGKAPDGRPYRASDPHLLGWVHAAEIDSFLRCYQRFGPKPLSDKECDDYIAETARIGEALGVLGPPRSQAELAAVLDGYRPELRGTTQARDTARFLLFKPPLPLLARAPYAALASAAVASLPQWTRWPLRLPYFPPVERTAVQLAGHGVVGVIRWAMAPT